MNTLHKTNKNKRLAFILMGAVSLLLIPLVGMQFSTEVNWSFFDFIVMGTLLLITGSMVEIMLRLVSGKENRIAAIAIVIFLFLLIWAELAVGIFGTPFAGN